jgi:hypothetical protein
LKNAARAECAVTDYPPGQDWQDVGLQMEGSGAT